MDLHSINTFGGSINNNSIMTIQNSIRGYLARRNLGDKKVNQSVSDLQNRAAKLVNRIIKTGESIETKWHYSQLGYDDHSFALMQLDYIKSCMSLKHLELRNIPRNTFVNTKSENDFIGGLHTHENELGEDLKKVFMRAGSMSLKYGLKTILGADKYLILSDPIKEKLEEYNGIFNPTGCTIFTQSEEELGGFIKLQNSEKKEVIEKKSTFEKNKIKFAYITNFNDNTITDTLNGAELRIPYSTNLGHRWLIVVKGFFKQNPLCYQNSLTSLSQKYYKMSLLFDKRDQIPEHFRKSYLKLYSVRDLILKTETEIIKDLEAEYLLVNTIANSSITTLYTKFNLLTPSQQARVLALLLMKESNIYAIALYETIAKDVPEFTRIVRDSLHYTLQKKLGLEYEKMQKPIDKLPTLDVNGLDYEARINYSKMDLQTKAKAREKVGIAKSQFNSESGKAQKYLDTLLSVPFGIYIEEDINSSSSPDAIQKHLKELKSNLDASVYGQENSKKAVLEWRGQRIQNGESKGECIAFVGPPGTGKTTFSLGIAKALNRPLVFIQLAGRRDGSYLLGHNYTYVGAKIGRIVEVLIEAGCMDPVIYIDEVDKVTGDEIMQILTAVTDFTQNHAHEDQYLSGIKIDLSRVLFILSFNDKAKLDLVFKDRLHIIEVDPLSQHDKIQVTGKHLMPDILKSCGFKPGEIYIEDADLKFLIENYTFEGGARKLKENLFSIVRQINLQRLLEPDSVKLPYKIDQASIIKFRDEPEIDFKKIAPKPHIGTINGLYATTAGIGGLTIIQALSSLSHERLALQLTGSQGKVMQESMSVARTVAWNVIPKDVKKRIQDEPPEGLHIHCPEGSTPKDGPSAGGAITTAIISRLCGIPIRNDVAMTGEIDLSGNITKIGGLDAKLHGAKKAGVRLALVPRENEKDLRKLKTKYPELIDDTFEVKLIDDIYDALENALVNCPFVRP